MGIEVVVPDVNRSVGDFAPGRSRPTTTAREKRSASSSASRRCATSARASSGCIVAEREANGPFADFYDFCERVDIQVLNKRTIESLIKAGAFDSLGHPRQGLLARRSSTSSTHTVARRRERDMGVMSLFGEIEDAGAAVRRAAADPRRRVRQAGAAQLREGDARPLRERPPAAWAPRRRCAAGADGTLADARRDRRRRDPHLRRRRHRRSSASGPRRATSWPSSPSRTSRPSVEVMVFPKTMTDHGHKLADDAVVIVQGPGRRAGRPAEAHRHGDRAVRADERRGRPAAGQGGRRRAVRGAHRPTSSACSASIPGDSPVLPPPRREQGAAAAGGVDASTSAPASSAELRVLLGPDRDHGLNATLTRGSRRLSRLFAVCQAAPELRRSGRIYWTRGLRTTSDPGAGSRMSIEVETKDCTALGDAELAEMADLCAEGPHAATRSGCCRSRPRRGCSSPRPARTTSSRASPSRTLERIGGTPCVLDRPGVGQAHGQARHRAPGASCTTSCGGPCWPSPTRTSSSAPASATPGRLRGLQGRSTTSCPGPTTRPPARSGPGAGAWPSASASTPPPTTTAPSWPRATATCPRCSTTRA